MGNSTELLAASSTAVEDLGRNASKAEEAIGKLMNSFDQMVDPDKLISKMYKFYNSSVNAANEAIAAEMKLQTVMRKRQGLSSVAVQSVMDHSKELSKSTTISSNAGMIGQAKLAETVQDPGNINQLTNAMYDLAAASYGVNVSQDQMVKTGDIVGKLMNGNMGALAESGFNLEGVFSAADEQLLKTGTEAERTALVLERLNGIVGGMSQLMAQTPEGKIKQLKDAWEDVKKEIGLGVVPQIIKLVDTINQNMPHIEKIGLGISVAFSAVTAVITDVISLIGEMANIVSSSWQIIEPIMWGMAGLLTSYLVPKMILFTKTVWGAVTALLAKVALMTIVNYKIIMIFMAIGALIGVLSSFGITIKDIATFIVQAIVGILVFLLNIFGFWSSLLVNIVKLVINAFSDPITAFNNFIYDIGRMSLEFIKNIAGAFDKLFGTNLKSYSEQAIENLKSRSVQKGVDVENRWEPKFVDHGAAAEWGAGLVDKASTKISSVLDKFKFPENDESLVPGASANQVQVENVGSVGEVGKINDTVDITSEDIKVMRELADVKNIQNFVTLTPSVSVQTGDITNGGFNIDNVVQKITEVLENDIAASAKGVYSYGV